jgi:hypothetical protein
MSKLRLLEFGLASRNLPLAIIRGLGGRKFDPTPGHPQYIETLSIVEPLSCMFLFHPILILSDFLFPSDRSALCGGPRVRFSRPRASVALGASLSVGSYGSRFTFHP